MDSNPFENFVAAAQDSGSASDPDTLRTLSEQHLVGDAITLGAVSFYDFLKKENAGKKVFICNGSACLCAGSQENLRTEMCEHFEEKEIGHICCLGRCHEAGAFQYKDQNYSAKNREDLATIFTSAEEDEAKLDRYQVGSSLDTPLLTADFP
ncbi:MAG: (2Fe-2S) ferredoxin domain-containing protein, partial [Verrucomicrobiales bacterium]|nr:(2Fe-2S) ferredoxin domain-containing protein [Verrucomicrobiales bacterium]